ncbi:MAG: hypothetical protein AAFR59_10150, partial [Bacteroidota bacterium]
METYSDPSNANVDRCAATFIIYDASFQEVANILDVPRSNGTLVSVGPDCVYDSARTGQNLF